MHTFSNLNRETQKQHGLRACLSVVKVLISIRYPTSQYHLLSANQCPFACPSVLHIYIRGVCLISQHSKAELRQLHVALNTTVGLCVLLLWFIQFRDQPTTLTVYIEISNWWLCMCGRNRPAFRLEDFTVEPWLITQTLEINNTFRSENVTTNYSLQLDNSNVPVLKSG